MNLFQYPFSLLILVATTFLTGCHHDRSSESNQAAKNKLSSYQLQTDYAKSFRVIYHEKYKEVIVNNAWKGSDRTFRYLLAPPEVELPDDDAEVIRVPVENIVCFSTTHIPLLDYLGVTDKLVGFPNTDFISSEKARLLIDQGEVADLGTTEDVNLEILLDLDPDLVMTFAMENDDDRFDMIKRAGIPVVFNADYMENTPLGRAEWIKFMSLFFNLEQKADSIFGKIEYAYDTLQQLVANAGQEPSVLSGIVYGDTWFMPGGENYAAKFFEDANSSYLWSDNDEISYLELSFESVYDQAADTEFWVGVGTYNSREELLEADSRYRDFKAFQENRVYNYNARMGATGGNEYFELGYLRPDLVLADLISIFHPELLPEYEMYFHKKLE